LIIYLKLAAKTGQTFAILCWMDNCCNYIFKQNWSYNILLLTPWL